jgi:hypothetical protein
MAIDQALGYCHYRRSVLMFAMQRVKSVRETGETFDRPADFRLDEYLAGSFRALRGEGDYDVVLRFSPSKIPELCMVSPELELYGVPGTLSPELRLPRSGLQGGQSKTPVGESPPRCGPRHAGGVTSMI